MLGGRKMGRIACPINVESLVVFQFSASKPVIAPRAITLKMYEIPIAFTNFLVVQNRVYNIFLRAIDIDGAGLVKCARRKFLIIVW